MIDLRAEIEQLLKDEGSHVLVIRANKKIRCGCWNDTPSGDCKICLGTGYVNSVERHLCYEQIASVPETLGRLIRTIEPSDVAIDARHYFFTGALQIEKNDIIVEANFKNRKPVPPINFFLVNHVVSPKIRNVPQYTKASTSLDPINATARGFHLRRLQDTINYDPIQ